MSANYLVQIWSVAHERFVGQRRFFTTQKAAEAAAKSLSLRYPHTPHSVVWGGITIAIYTNGQRRTVGGA